ncbi:uncharacterized protein LOC112962485 [Apteryx rowi]|uniref:uncharacterized protein LOC112962485 n=1 Tax=Apteryx rowi TaxID=308060 RepID=UPI000E1C5504|nr:uncharacterized protein LOC112962485 [Apteryx rowi]
MCAPLWQTRGSTGRHKPAGAGTNEARPRVPPLVYNKYVAGAEKRGQRLARSRSSPPGRGEKQPGKQKDEVEEKESLTDPEIQVLQTSCPHEGCSASVVPSSGHEIPTHARADPMCVLHSCIQASMAGPEILLFHATPTCPAQSTPSSALPCLILKLCQWLRKPMDPPGLQNQQLSASWQSSTAAKQHLLTPQTSTQQNTVALLALFTVTLCRKTLIPEKLCPNGSDRSMFQN